MEELSHNEVIICQGCGQHQIATVCHMLPWYSYVHECKICGYINMESDWESVDYPELEPYRGNQPCTKRGRLDPCNVGSDACKACEHFIAISEHERLMIVACGLKR